MNQKGIETSCIEGLSDLIISGAPNPLLPLTMMTAGCGLDPLRAKRSTRTGPFDVCTVNGSRSAA